MANIYSKSKQVNPLEFFSDLPRWVSWKYTPDGRKPPLNPKNGKRASVRDPETWGTRYDARKCTDSGGVGFVLGDIGNGYGIGGIDLDRCLDDDGALRPWAKRCIEICRSYAV